MMINMETKFNFNSQVCTSRSQSERLLALGLKPETADMCYIWEWETGSFTLCPVGWNNFHRTSADIPAWSLHRLMCLVFNSGGTHVDLFEDDDAYENLIYNIEWRIKEGCFNEEYLVNQAEIDEHCKGVLEYLDYIRGEEE